MSAAVISLLILCFEIDAEPERADDLLFAEIVVKIAVYEPGGPPFVVTPRVWQSFDSRMLRQNRRVVADEAGAVSPSPFRHQPRGATAIVRDFFVHAYVRSARAGGSAEQTALECSTAVFTKRQYRDAWDRCIIRKLGKMHNHTRKVKVRVRARGQRGSNWYGETRAQ